MTVKFVACKEDTLLIELIDLAYSTIHCEHPQLLNFYIWQKIF